MDARVTRRFPLPSEIEDVPGAEGWRDMYPFFSRFRPEGDNRFWFYNSMHFPEPMPSFDSITSEVPYTGLGAYTTRVFAFPTALGIDHRIINGRVYISANTVTDPAEIERRLQVFQQRAPYYYENWNALYQQWEQRLRGLIAEVDAIQVPQLPEFEDEAVVREARGIAQNHYVRAAFHRCIECYSKMWHHHFEFGVDAPFVDGADPHDVLTAVARLGEPGKRWLAALEKSRDPWFNTSTGDGFYNHHRSWNDDLSVPFSALPRYVAMVRAGKSIDRPTEQLRRERLRIIGEYRELLATDAERTVFDQMLGLCHVVFPYVEDHKFYCEHWFTTRFYSKMREFGALLARKGVLDDGEDVFHLHHFEVDQALWE